MSANGTGPLGRIAYVQGVEESLLGLLADLLEECGFALTVEGRPELANLVIVPVAGEGGLLRLKRLTSRVPRHPVLALLPFADDAMAEAALRSGATASYALGTPLDRFRAAVRAACAANG